MVICVKLINLLEVAQSMKFALGEIRGMKDPLTSLIDKEIPIKAAWKLKQADQSI